MEIIDNKNLSDAQKQEAVDQLLLMTDLAEKEEAAETMLASKGFKEAVVSLTSDGADVVVVRQNCLRRTGRRLRILLPERRE